MFELTDKVSLVTGATSGIGRGAAIAFAKQGAKVVVAGRRESQGQAVVDEIKANGGDALFVQADVSIESDVQALFENAKAHYGSIDIVFLNAGFGVFSPITDQVQADLDSQIDVNIKGVFYGIKHASKHLGKGSSIIINSSVVAAKGFPNAAAYSLTKGAVNTLTRTAALELVQIGIRVNSVGPGPIWTEGAEKLVGTLENFEKSMGSMVPMGRVGQVEEIAAAVVFLASDEASFITGQILYVDGGLTAT